MVLEEHPDLAGHPGLLIGENPDVFIHCDNPHAELDVGKHLSMYSLVVVFHVVLSKQSWS